MDPQAALERMFDAVAEGDADEAREALADLVGWMSRGGHAPDVERAIASQRRRVADAAE